MKFRGNDDTIASKTTDRAAIQVRVVEAESSQLRVGQVVSTDSHRKWLAEQGQFYAPRSIRRRAMRSDEQLRDNVEVVHVGAVKTNVDKETYLFHLSFGEMTITLDNVSSLSLSPHQRSILHRSYY